MADALTNITNFISSPPGQLTAGAVLAGIVWKFFEKVEDVLTDDTKLEIAVWLLNRPSPAATSPVALPPLEIIPKLKITATEASFKQIWKLLGLVTCGLAFISLLFPSSISRSVLAVYMQKGGFEASNFFGLFFFVSLFATIGTHVSLLAANLVFRRLAGVKSKLVLWASLAANFLLSLALAGCGVVFLLMLGSFDATVRQAVASVFSAARLAQLFTSLRTLVTLVLWKTNPFFVTILPMALINLSTTIWVTAGIILRHYADFYKAVMSRLPFWLGWFNRYFDIERKPLSAIGLVAGCIVALLWWGFVLVKWIV